MTDPDINTDRLIDLNNSFDHMVNRVLDAAVDAGHAGVATEAVGRAIIAIGKYIVAAELENRRPKVN